LKPAPFAYARARSLSHAIDLLGQGDTRILAGGQSLMATLNLRLDRPALLVDINAIAGLDHIALRDGHVEIGALVRHAAAERSQAIATHVPLIAAAMPHIGHPAILNRGTIGGSVAFSDPAAELPACIVALDAELDVEGPDGRRMIKADAFFTALFQTALGPQDVLTAIRFPAANATSRFGFAEFARRHGDYAIVGLAACARAENQRLMDARLVYFGVNGVPVRARSAEAALSSNDVEGAVGALAQDLHPGDDIQATAAVRTHLAGVLLRRVARQLMTVSRQEAGA
jgi:carbon-monoxide dehydrogenase medium subunit